MKTLRGILVICLTSLLAQAPVLGDDSAAARFTGEWTNKDFETRGMTRISIRNDGTTFFVHAWGRCHPEECDWGEVHGALKTGDDRIMVILWKTPFSVRSQELKLLDDGRVESAIHTHFTDGGKRKDYDSKEVFAKGLVHDWRDQPQPRR